MDYTRRPSPDDPPRTCPDCQGRGWKDLLCHTEHQAVTCPACNGIGHDPAGRTCLGCQGTGRIDSRTEKKAACPLCRGAGLYPVPESMTEAEFAFRPGKAR